LRLIRDLSPDVAVLDIDMPLMKGLQVVKTMQAEHLATAVIILTIYTGGDLLDEALDAGVKGYVTKETAVLHVLEA
ncbi:response regulator, partial [Streptococcus pyogenes]